MFPIRDDNPQILTPYATYGIVLVNVAAWVLLQGLGAEPSLSGSICRFGLIPGELLQLVPAGSRLQLGPETFCVLGDTSVWHTTLSSMFMHGSWMHIIGNMWFLWIFGNNVEDAMGHIRFVLFYLLCGLAAAAGRLNAGDGDDRHERLTIERFDRKHSRPWPGWGQIGGGPDRSSGNRVFRGA